MLACTRTIAAPSIYRGACNIDSSSSAASSSSSRAAQCYGRLAPHRARQTARSRSLAPVIVAALTPTEMFSVTSILMVPVYGLMISAPKSRLTNAVVESGVLDVGLGLLYCYALVQAIQGGLLDTLWSLVNAVVVTLHPNHEVVASMFNKGVVMALTWVHLLLLDFYQAREVMRDGILHNVVTGHSLVLCFMFGPTGLLCHVFTRYITKLVRKRLQLMAA